jgi:hypothetical protein
LAPPGQRADLRLAVNAHRAVRARGNLADEHPGEAVGVRLPDFSVRSRRRLP